MTSRNRCPVMLASGQGTKTALPRVRGGGWGGQDGNGMGLSSVEVWGCSTFTSRQEQTDRTINPSGSPPGRRMIEDMTIRGLAPKSQATYVRAVKDFTIFLGRSPDRAGLRTCGAISCIWPPAAASRSSAAATKASRPAPSRSRRSKVEPGDANAARHRRGPLSQ